MRNKKIILSGNKAACYYCCKIFDSKEVVDFIKEKDGDSTALCPRCGIDTLISDSQAELSPEFIKAMQQHYFKY